LPSPVRECPNCHRCALAAVQNRHLMKQTPYFQFWRAVGHLSAALLAGTAFAQPLVTCQVTYAGATQTVVAPPVPDPYPVPSVDIGGRFAFKAVMVGDAQKVERIVLYAYLAAQPHPVLIHQAKYLPPFPRSVAPWAFTGQHHVYGGPQERELIYSCTLEGWAP
jgi:hypothetical protein